MAASISRTDLNTYNFLRWRKVNLGTLSDLPVCDIEPIVLAFGLEIFLITDPGSKTMIVEGSSGVIKIDEVEVSFFDGVPIEFTNSETVPVVLKVVDPAVLTRIDVSNCQIVSFFNFAGLPNDIEVELKNNPIDLSAAKQTIDSITQTNALISFYDLDFVSDEILRQSITSKSNLGNNIEFFDVEPSFELL